MSIDDPNEYEQAIEDYGEAVRCQADANTALLKAQREAASALFDRQAKWRRVMTFVNTGKIEYGIYRLDGPGRHADGVLIDGARDYPDLFPMFR